MTRKYSKKNRSGCRWNYECDRCGAPDCIATVKEILQLQSEDNDKTKRRYSLEAYGIKTPKKRGKRNGLQKCTSAKYVKAIRAVENWYKDDEDGCEYVRELAEVEFEDGHKKYAHIGSDSNLTAIYDVVGTLLQQPRHPWAKDIGGRIVYTEGCEE